MGQTSVAEVLAVLGGVATTAELRRAGLTRDAVRWALDRGVLHRVGRGIFVDGVAWAAGDERHRHRSSVLAQQRKSPELVAAGLSAAAVWGLPLPRGVPDPPQLVTPRDEDHVGAVGVRGGALQRRSWLTRDEIGESERVRLTTPVRTVVDCCRELDDGWALAVADAAARFHGVTREQLARHVRGAAPGPGRVRALWVAEHLDARSESPLESLNRAVLIHAGFRPEPQVWVDTDRNAYRVDLLDRANRVISEADGRQKYEQEQEPATPWEDKLRQDALWDSGFEVVRFTMTNYYSGRPAYLASYQRAIHRAAQRSVPRLWG